MLKIFCFVFLFCCFAIICFSQNNLSSNKPIRKNRKELFQNSSLERINAASGSNKIPLTQTSGTQNNSINNSSPPHRVHPNSHRKMEEVNPKPESIKKNEIPQINKGDFNRAKNRKQIQTGNSFR